MIATPSKLLVPAVLLLYAACIQPSLVAKGVDSETVYLSASSKSVQSGEAVTLNWNTGGPRAYLSGVGSVGTQGTAVVVPQFTTTYSLITDTPSLRRDTTITIVGIKGDYDSFPKQSEYNGHQEHSKSVSSLVDYLGMLRQLLQNDLKFIINDFSRNDTHFFQTHLSETSSFSPIKEYGMRAQKISYLIAITQIAPENCPPKSRPQLGLPKQDNSASTHASKLCIKIDVAANIQYQRLSEDEWRLNNNPDLCRERSSAFLTEISKLQ